MALQKAKEYKVQVPFDKRTFLTPDARKVAFKQIYEGYPKRFNNLKPIWAYLNYDEKVMVDYALIYTGRNATNTGDLILYLVEPPYSDRCTPSYKYCRQTNQTEKFFKYGMHSMVIMQVKDFYEYLNRILDLDRDKKSDKYWKSQKNAKKLAKGLLDLALYDTKDGLIRDDSKDD